MQKTCCTHVYILQCSLSSNTRTDLCLRCPSSCLLVVSHCLDTGHRPIAPPLGRHDWRVTSNARASDSGVWGSDDSFLHSISIHSENGTMILTPAFEPSRIWVYSTVVNASLDNEMSHVNVTATASTKATLNYNGNPAFSGVPVIQPLNAGQMNTITITVMAEVHVSQVDSTVPQIRSTPAKIRSTPT